MNIAHPLVSVIMPAYNTEEYIEDAVRSVMTQTFQNWELLVVDDHSTDSTCAIIESLATEDDRIILIKNENNLGVSKTRNRGLSLAKGDYIAFLDGDDVWAEDKLEKQLKTLHETGADFSYTSYSIIDKNGNRLRPDYCVPPAIDYNGLLKENVIGCSTVMMSASIAKEYSFNANYFHEDYLLWLRLLSNGYRAAGCRDVLTSWRMTSASRSANKFRGAVHRWRIYRDYLELSLPKSLWFFLNYALLSLKKYFI